MPPPPAPYWFQAFEHLLGSLPLLLQIVTAVGVIVVAFINFRTKASMEKSAKAQAVGVAEVKETLSTTNAAQSAKLDDMAKVADRTELLCNHAHEEALQMVATTARAKANITHDPVDIVAADLADRMLAEHKAKQARVDAKDAQEAKATLPFRPPGN